MEHSELIKKAALLRAKEEEVETIRSELPTITDTLAATLIEYLDKLSAYDCEQQLIHLFTTSSCENVKQFYQSLLDQIDKLYEDISYRC